MTSYIVANNNKLVFDEIEQIGALNKILQPISRV